MRTIILTLMFLCSVAACNAPKEPTDHNVLTVSIEPIRYFAESIAGNRFRVTTLVPRGSSPETYEPTPRQLVDLSESKAYLSVGGLGFEQTWMQKLTANIPDLPVINLSKGIEPLRGSHGQGVDPHIWTSPKNAAIMARNLYQVLCQIDSASAPYYRQRFEQLLTRIDSVDQVLHHLLDGAESRTFLIYHPALGYLARDYGLRQLCLEEGGKEPTPARLRSLIRQSKEAGATVLFVQQAFSQEGARALARETGTQIVRINPLGYDWPEETLRVARALNRNHENS